MKKFVFGLGLVALAGSAAAQEAAVSEADVRCRLFSECKVGAEKKFSLGNISNAPSANRPAAAPIVRGPAGSASAPKPNRTRYTSDPARPAPGARPVGGRTSLDMRLTFELGSAELTPGARSQADVFAKVLNDYSSSAGRFVIEGHTDSIGSSASNMDLSRRRAQSVVAYLVDHGVSASKLQAVGYGFSRPRAGMSAGNPANRRVEIVKN